MEETTKPVAGPGRALQAVALALAFGVACAFLLLRKPSDTEPPARTPPRPHGSVGPEQPRTATGLLATGDRPSVALKDLAGVTRSPADHVGKVVVLNVWASWCPPCIEEMPSLEALHRAGGDVVVLSVTVDERSADAERVVKSLGLTFPVLLDPGGDHAASWGTVKFPETWILDRQGAVHSRVVGPADWSAPGAREALLAIPAARP